MASALEQCRRGRDGGEDHGTRLSFAGARKTGRNDAVNALVKSGRTSTEHGGGALVLGIPSDGRSVAVNATVKSGRKSTEHGGGAM